MVARSKSIERVEETAANCLMLLPRDEKYCGERRRVFRCKTCLKEFSSFQALGGHRTSHTKPLNIDNDSSVRRTFSNKKPKTTTSHNCPICGVEFPMGQALGGHMRRHRNKKGKAFEEFITLSLLPETKTTLQKLNSGEIRLASLDLDSMENLVNTELELGRTIY